MLKRQRIRKKMYITKEMNQHVTKWEEGSLYSHPLSSLTIEAHQSWGMWNIILCLIVNATKDSGDF